MSTIPRSTQDKPIQLHTLVRSVYFWIVVGMLALGAFLHYFTPQVRSLPYILSPLVRHTVERIIFVLPVAAAAFAFGRTGGLVTLGLAVLIMLPRILFISSEPADASFEMLGVCVVSLIIIWIIDMQERERRLRQKAVEELETLNVISATLCQSLELDVMLQRALDKVLEVVEPLEPRGAVFLLDAAEEKLQLRVHRGLSPELVEQDREVPVGECLCGQAADGREVLIVLDALSDPRHTRCPETVPHSHVCVPMQSKKRLMGVIDLYLSDPRPLDVVDRKLFASIGRQIGVAVENARLYENLRFYLRQISRAQENERKRVARELHDDTAQGLIDLSRRLDRLTLEEQLPASAAERLEELHELIEGLLKDVRRFSRDLRPSVLDDLGLLPALEGLLADLEAVGIQARLEITGERRRLPSDAELELFRITQEALSNVRRHSQASEVLTTVEFGETRVRITIHDNGKGFEFPATTGDLVTRGMFGLVGMEERAQLLGGRLHVLSGQQVGTIVVVDVSA